MATRIPPSTSPEHDYPSSDGKPMAESDLHRDNMLSLIDGFRRHFADDPMTYVSGNMMMYYVPGDKRRHLAPDVFVVRGVPNRLRLVYLTWIEGKGPDLVIEVTSKTTRREDLRKKFELYRDVLKVREYILWDPMGEYLDPPLRGYRLVGGEYVPIEPVAGRLPSEVTGLHLEGGEPFLRLYDPARRRYLVTWPDALGVAEAEKRQAEAEKRQAETEARQAKTEARREARARRQAEAARREAEAEAERLRREVDELRRKLSGGKG